MPNEKSNSAHFMSALQVLPTVDLELESGFGIKGQKTEWTSASRVLPTVVLESAEVSRVPTTPVALADIHFHDSILRRVVELPGSHDLLFEVHYPVDWENKLFEPRVIAFRDVLNYRIEEGPFVGAPTLLDAYSEGSDGEWKRVTLQTNAGTRSLSYRSVELLTVQEAQAGR